MKSGELAKRTGVSADTLHHYEKKGLLAPSSRQDNGYRHYAEDAVQRVLLIQRALKLGFTLGELAPFLKERDHGGTPCQSVRRLATIKLKEIDERLEALTLLRQQFVDVIEHWDADIESTPVGEQARLLEKLPDLKTPTARPKGIRARSHQ